MAMLVELHMQGQDKFVYTCNNCKNSVETRFHCTVCEDFDLCKRCYLQVGHEHKMEQMDLGLDVESPGAPSHGTVSANRRQSVQHCINSLVHACQCKNANCSSFACMKMKKVVSHTKSCKKKTNGCPICKQLFALCLYHAKFCQEAKCQVPFCFNLKMKLKQQEKQHRLQRSLLTRRRMAIMENVGQGGPNTPAAPATPQQEQPTTPINSYVVAGTPNTMTQTNSVGTSNSNHGKMASNILTSPHSGKGIGQKPIGQKPINQQHNVGNANTINQYTTANIQSQGNNTYSAQVGLVSPQQNIRPSPPYNSPPTRALMAAKQAEQVARFQANVNARPSLQSFPRSVNPNVVQRGSGTITPQSQWPTHSGGDITFTRQPGSSNLGMPDPGSNAAAMQRISTPTTLHKTENRYVNMITRNPELTAHVIKQTRQQHQRPQNVVQGVGLMTSTIPQQRIIQQNQVTNQQLLSLNSQPQQHQPINIQQMQTQQISAGSVNVRQVRHFQQQQYSPAPPYNQTIINQQRLPNNTMTNPNSQQALAQFRQQQLRVARNQAITQRLQNPAMMSTPIGQQNMAMGQQQLNIAQSPMLPQSGMTNQPNLMTGQQAMNSVPSNALHQSRSPSQSLTQSRVPSISPHSGMGGNARTTPLSGQVQMVSPLGGVTHVPGGTMITNYNRTMGSGLSSSGLSINYPTNNANQITNPTMITNEGLEKYVTNDE